MSHSLSFTEEFFTGRPNEPFHEGLRPTSVKSAAHTRRHSISGTAWWYNMCRHVFKRFVVSVDDVVAKVRETNTCSNLNSPVEVWIDKDGLYTVLVYDKEQ